MPYTYLIILIIASIIPYCILLTAIICRNTKYFKILKKISLILVTFPILFSMFIGYEEYKNTTTRGVIETVNCNQSKFNFVRFSLLGDTIASKYTDEFSSVDEIAKLTKVGWSDYTATHIDRSDIRNYSDEYLIQYHAKQKEDFKELINCKEFKYNAVYQINPNDEKSRCYLLNRSKLTDYPECSKGIKAKFEMN